MWDLRSYVVRVYRRQAGSMAGTVQDVGTGRIVPFQTMEELWQAVRVTPSSSAPGTKGGRAKRRASRTPDLSEPNSGSNGE